VAPRPQCSAPSHPGRASAWRLGGLAPAALARQVWERMWAHSIDERAASLSYYFLFALFPALLFLTALLGLIPVPRMMDRLMGYARQVLPPDAASVVDRTLGEVVSGASGGLASLGVLVALWAASNGMASLMSAMNVTFAVEDARAWWRRRLAALLLTVGFSMFTMTALLLLVFGERIGEALAEWVGMGPAFTAAWRVVRWPVVILCGLTGINLVYHLAPASRTRWTWFSPGSVFALGGCLAMTAALRLYLAYIGNYNATYGSIGGVIILMLWLYLTSLALLVGAEIDSAVTDAERRSEDG
jgi:membrane protein